MVRESQIHVMRVYANCEMLREGNWLCEGPADEGCKQRVSSTLNELRSRNYVIGIINSDSYREE